MEDTEQTKLFVGGISWETTDDILKQYFRRYGTVLDSVIVKDLHTGCPRGFAFVTFSESSAVERALQDSHQIIGRMVEVRKAIPRSGQQSQTPGLSRSSSSSSTNNNHFRTKKIFVGGLSANLTEEEFRSYFEKYGRITDVVVMHDNVTHRPRGFGFITFESEDNVEEVMQKNFHELSGKLVEVKRAVPKDGSRNGSDIYNRRLGSGRGPNFNSYQKSQESSAAYYSRFEYFPTGYCNVAGYSYVAGIYGGIYPSGGYGGICYGFAPFGPTCPWSPSVFGVNGSLFPCTHAAVYPTYLNGGHGIMAVAANGDDEIMDTGFSRKSAQLGSIDAPRAADSTPSLTIRNNL